jgi:hypothetical protein
VERKYLRALSAAVPLSEWRLVIAKALEQAKAGDALARAWLSKHLVGDDPLTLEVMAEQLDELRAHVEQLTRQRESSNGRA